MRIPFDIKHRDKIESGEYKVETRDGRSARIICWDVISNSPIVALLMFNDGTEFIGEFTREGNYWNSKMESCKDLFIVIPNPEMSEFEKAVSKYRPQSDTLETIQRIATELLSLARNEFNKQIENDYREIIHGAYERGKADAEQEVERRIQSGELMTQEHHEILMATLNKAHEEELEKAYKNSDEVQYRKGYEKGKEDALNNLPRWKKCPENDYYACVYNCAKREDSLLYYNGHTLRLIDLEKLPGFNEENYE